LLVEAAEVGVVLQDGFAVFGAADIDFDHPVAGRDSVIERSGAVLGVLVVNDTAAMGNEPDGLGGL